MPLTIALDLVGTGWARFTVRPARRNYTFVASYESDALGDIILAAHSILSNFRSISFAFHGSQTIWLWRIQQTSDYCILVEVDEVSPTISEARFDVELVVSFSCSAVAFAKAVHSAASIVVEKNGVAGYNRLWAEHLFPAEQYRLLGKRIAAAENET